MLRPPRPATHRDVAHGRGLSAAAGFREETPQGARPGSAASAAPSQRRATVSAPDQRTPLRARSPSSAPSPAATHPALLTGPDPWGRGKRRGGADLSDGAPSWPEAAGAGPGGVGNEEGRAGTPSARRRAIVVAAYAAQLIPRTIE